jgi:hypothetical protein
MKKMDVYLSSEAQRYLEGMALSRSCLEGILIGHKRGYEYYIEQVFPFDNALGITDKSFAEINGHFDDKVIGFYTFSSEKREAEKVFVPFAVGKVLLRVKTDRMKGISVKSFCIDYDDAFSLKSMDTHIINRE